MSNKTFLGKVGTTPKGEWSASVTYERLDWVTYQGSSYIALAQNTNSTPSDNNSNWMIAAKHGEFTEQQLEDFKAAVVADSKQEMDAYTDTKKGVLDTYTTAKKGELDIYESAKETELNTYTGTKKGELDTHTTQKISDFDSNATAKTGTFNDNATSKTSTFNTNASNKTTAFNDNATAKTTAFDEHVASKTQDFDDHIADFQGELNNLEEVLGIDVDTYSSSSTYALGDLVVYENKVYKCTTAIAVAEEWDSTKWTEVDVLELINNINSNLAVQNETLSYFQEQYQAMLRSRKYTTGTGESVTLDKTAEGVEFRKPPLPSGNSKQTQLTGKNLFDKNNLTQYGFTGTVDGDGAIIYNAGSSASNSITISGFKENTQYSFHCEGKNYGSGDAGQGNIKVYYTDGTDSGTNFFIFQMSNTYKAKEFTTASGKTINYVRFNNGGNGSNYSWKLNIDTMQIEEGTSYTSYEPYCGGIPSPNPTYTQDINSSGDSGSINNKVENKNLFDVNKFEELLVENKRLDDNGNEVTDNTSWYSTYKIFLKANQPYMLKGKFQRIYYYDNNKNFLSRSQNYMNSVSFSYTPQNDGYIGFQITKSFWDANKGAEQIEEGSTTTSYTPHAEQNFILPCQQPMRSIGTTRDCFFKNVVGSEYYNSELELNAWYERHPIYRKIFNGTEDVRSVGERTNGIIITMPMDNIKDFGNVVGLDVMCNSLITANSQQNDTIGICQHNKILYFEIEKGILETIDEAGWKAYLAQQYANNTPVYVDYILETPTYLQCTSAQVTVLEAICKAKSYYEKTTVGSTDPVPPIYEVEAYQDENLVIDEINQAIVALGGV